MRKPVAPEPACPQWRSPQPSGVTSSVPRGMRGVPRREDPEPHNLSRADSWIPDIPSTLSILYINLPVFYYFLFTWLWERTPVQYRYKGPDFIITPATCFHLCENPKLKASFYSVCVWTGCCHKRKLYPWPSSKRNENVNQPHAVHPPSPTADLGGIHSKGNGLLGPFLSTGSGGKGTRRLPRAAIPTINLASVTDPYLKTR